MELKELYKAIWTAIVKAVDANDEQVMYERGFRISVVKNEFLEHDYDGYLQTGCAACQDCNMECKLRKLEVVHKDNDGGNSVFCGRLLDEIEDAGHSKATRIKAAKMLKAVKWQSLK